MDDGNPDDPCLNAQMTWANRNPTMEVQSARPQDKISTIEQNTQNLGKATKKIKNTQLTADIDTLQLERSAQINALALKHHQKPSHILNILNNSSHYKTTRLPTLQNALVHHKALEVNEGVLLYLLFAVKSFIQ
jgi:hypothetical protein